MKHQGYRPSSSCFRVCELVCCVIWDQIICQWKLRGQYWELRAASTGVVDRWAIWEDTRIWLIIPQDYKKITNIKWKSYSLVFGYLDIWKSEVPLRIKWGWIRVSENSKIGDHRCVVVFREKDAFVSHLAILIRYFTGGEHLRHLWKEHAVALHFESKYMYQ